MILAIDFHSKKNPLLVSLLKNKGIHVYLKTPESLTELDVQSYDIVLLLGGGIQNPFEFKIISSLIENARCVLGICYGYQLLHLFHGGEIMKLNKRNVGMK